MKIRDEWLILQTEFQLPECSRKNRIDHIWQPVLQVVNHSSSLKYPNLCILVKACFTLCHGNSDVERGFSISKNVMPEEKSLMSDKMLNARLNIKDCLNKYKSVAEIPITKTIIKMTYDAYKSYNHYLEEEKRKKEKLREKEEEKKNQMADKKISNKINVISNLEEKAFKLFKDQTERASSTDALLKEGNEKLQRAIKSGNMVQIKVAHELLQAAEQSRLIEKEQHEEATKIN